MSKHRIISKKQKNGGRVKTKDSSICRVHKNGYYTVMSNFHLRSTNLTLKAIGLLSKVLSLPERWDYSVSGLVAICKEKETAVRSALKELKEWGYLEVTKLMPNQTKSGRIEYVYDFFEYSAKDDPDSPEYLGDPEEDAKIAEGYGDEDDYDEIGCYDEDDNCNENESAEKQGIDFLHLEILPVEIQDVENQGQLNKGNL